MHGGDCPAYLHRPASGGPLPLFVGRRELGTGGRARGSGVRLPSKRRAQAREQIEAPSSVRPHGRCVELPFLFLPCRAAPARGRWASQITRRRWPVRSGPGPPGLRAWRLPGPSPRPVAAGPSGRSGRRGGRDAEAAAVGKETPVFDPASRRGTLAQTLNPWTTCSVVTAAPGAGYALAQPKRGRRGRLTAGVLSSVVALLPQQDRVEPQVQQG